MGWAAYCSPGNTFRNDLKVQLMTNRYHKIFRCAVWIGLCGIGMIMFSGCMAYQYPGQPTPSPGPIPGYSSTPPTLSNPSVSPNPASAGSIVNLSVSYVDPEGDLQYGVAAVSVNGGDISRISFRSTYVSGVLTIPLAVSHFSRPSNLQILLKVRDSAGNWSNAVSTTLSVR